jgi:hypothetical protein
MFCYGRRGDKNTIEAWELGPSTRNWCLRGPGTSSLCPPQEIPLHSNVYEVYATDKDEGLNGAVRYSFLKTAGNRDWEYFTIDPISGLIQTAQRLDREKQALYSVRAQSLGGAGWTLLLDHLRGTQQRRVCLGSEAHLPYYSSLPL